MLVRLPPFYIAVATFIVLNAMGTNLSSAQIKKKTDSGIPLDEQIHINVENTLLHISAGYLWPWPSSTSLNGQNNQERVDFDFWMPDRRYPEINPVSNALYQPREAGRPKPPPDAYIVHVRQLKPVKADNPNYRSPEQGFQNLTSIAGLSSYSFQEEPFGLVRFWRHDWQYAQPEAFIWYRQPEGADVQVLLRCTQPSAHVISTCSGELYFGSENLAFQIYFPKERLTNWRDIAIAVRDLYK